MCNLWGRKKFFHLLFMLRHHMLLTDSTGEEKKWRKGEGCNAMSEKILFEESCLLMKRGGMRQGEGTSRFLPLKSAQISKTMNRDVFLLFLRSLSSQIGLQRDMKPARTLTLHSSLVTLSTSLFSSLFFFLLSGTFYFLSSCSVFVFKQVRGKENGRKLN